MATICNFLDLVNGSVNIIVNDSGADFQGMTFFDGNLYVGDNSDNTVKRFSTSGVLLGTLNLGEFNSIKGLDRDGNSIVVADFNGRLKSFDPFTGALQSTVFASVNQLTGASLDPDNQGFLVSHLTSTNVQKVDNTGFVFDDVDIPALPNLCKYMQKLANIGKVGFKDNIPLF